MADTFTHVFLTTLGKVASAGAERWLDSSIGGNPIGKGVFTVLDDAVVAETLVEAFNRGDVLGKNFKLTPC